MLRSQSALGLAGRCMAPAIMVILLSVPTGITATIPTPAHPMDITARRGSMAASSSAPAPGTEATVIGAGTDIVAVIMDGPSTAGLDGVMDVPAMDMDARVMVAASVVRARCEADSPVESTAT